MKHYPLSIVLVALFFAGSLFSQEVTSPDGSISIKLDLAGEQPNYRISCDGQEILEPSPLGLETSLGSFSTGLTSTGYDHAVIEEDYVLPHGKVSQVHYRANELTAHFTNAKGNMMDVIFRVSDRDVAFCYKVNSKETQFVIIDHETTGFNFPAEATAFVTQQVPWGWGFKKSKPSYEEAYQVDVPVGTKSSTGLGFTFPALFRIGSHGWVLLSETGVSSRYAGCRLSDPTEDGLYHIAFPEKEENAGIGDSAVAAPLPATTAWRTITLGETLAPVVETTVATDVVKPLYEASRNYEPGKATWSWILWQDPSMNMKDQKTFIDLAGDMGFRYILVDAYWDQNIGRDKMPELVKYANDRGVDILLWYNSNGSWNDAFLTPRNYMDTAPVRQQEMAWLQSIGVKGLKVDFFGGDKQVTMKYYEDIMTDANHFGLCLNFHGATLPRGWERMYPNYMTSEAITASENLVFTQDFADIESINSTIFSFVRNSVAPMDYGPVFLNKRFSGDPEKGNIRRTTDAFQLATAVIFQSPIQHFGITPNNLEEQPVYVIDFLKQVPTAWDEIRFIDGYPGKYVIFARRAGDRWYIGATHSGLEKREFSIHLPWLKGKELELYYDQPDRSAGYKKVSADAEGNITLSLEPQGGTVLVSEASDS
jgi:hypothetical protein